jgi:hypothetical protein
MTKGKAIILARKSIYLKSDQASRITIGWKYTCQALAKTRQQTHRTPGTQAVHGRPGVAPSSNRVEVEVGVHAVGLWRHVLQITMPR